ncbi:MAG: response regulator [Bacteroidota bacterium]|jgi:DNA-binding NtrC family response regulator
MELKKNILIIDDELIILDSLKIQLERMIGNTYDIEAASSGEEAIELIDDMYEKNLSLFMIISDYNLDDMKGTQILKHALNKFPNVKKVIISGQLDEDDIRNFHSTYGLDLRLGKPWNIYELTAILN